MTIEANYEIIRFIEHGNRCRPAMDCVPGELLIYRVRRCTVIDKETLFEWMKELLQQLEQFQRCRNNQGYRYVNPYSVLVTRDDRLVLLDLEAESNGFVLKNMQKRAMRNHFVKPIVHIRENTKITLDLYGYGKTIQFILANTEVEPSLSKREENRIAKLIERCIGESSGKLYESFGQVRQDIPAAKKAVREKVKGQKKWFVLLGGMLCMLAFAIWRMYDVQTAYQQAESRGEFLAAEAEDLRVQLEEQQKEASAKEKKYKEYYIRRMELTCRTDKTEETKVVMGIAQELFPEIAEEEAFQKIRREVEEKSAEAAEEEAPQENPSDGQNAAAPPQTQKESAEKQAPADVETETLQTEEDPAGAATDSAAAVPESTGEGQTVENTGEE